MHGLEDRLRLSCTGDHVARILIAHRRGRRLDATPTSLDGRRPLRVRIVGQLSAADLRRLEAACGPALEHQQLALELNLQKARTVDQAAAEYLQRLLARGARVVPESEQWTMKNGQCRGNE